MIIFNHPAFPTVFRVFHASERPFSARNRTAAAPAISGESACFARNRRFIKPNKTEPFLPLAARAVIGEITPTARNVAEWNKPKMFLQSNHEKDPRMTVLHAVELVVLAGIAVVAVLVVLLDRAGKAIEQMGIDPDRL